MHHDAQIGDIEIQLTYSFCNFHSLTVCWIGVDVSSRTSSGARRLVTRRALATTDPESYTQRTNPDEETQLKST